MRWYQLQPGWQTILDVGHSDTVTSLHVERDRGLVMSAGEDGQVFVRDPAAGAASVVAPLHTAAVRQLLPMPGDPTRLLVLTRAGLVAFDTVSGRSGALDGSIGIDYRAAAVLGDAVVLGTADGELWWLSGAAEPRVLARLGAAVTALVSDPSGRVVVAATAAGTLHAIDAPGGHLRWSRHDAPGEVLALVATADTVLVGGAGPDARTGVLRTLALAGGEVLATASRPGRIDVVALAADGTTRCGGVEVVAPGGATISALALGPSGTGWWGTVDGAVGCTDGRILPSRSSGVIAVALAEDEQEVATVDGRVLVRLDPRRGEVRSTVETPGAIAVGYAADGPVVGLVDGRIMAVGGPAGRDGGVDAARSVQTSCGRLRTLGSFGGLIVAQGTDGVQCFDGDTLEPASLPAAFLEGVGVVVRVGAWFESRGALVGWRFAFLDGALVAVERPGALGVTPEGERHHVVRVWDGDTFIEPDAVPVTS